MDMVKVQIKDLEGRALDWAVAKALQSESKLARAVPYENSMSAIVVESNGFGLAMERGYFMPSICWKKAGPLIEKYDAEFTGRNASNRFRCEVFEGSDGWGCAWGNDRLSALCRAIVCLKMKENDDSNYVEVPAVFISKESNNDHS